jgi:hypothetical protein
LACPRDTALVKDEALVVPRRRDALVGHAAVEYQKIGPMSATKLTDTQLVLLSAAAQHPEGAIDAASGVKGGATTKAIGKFLRDGFIEEIPARGELPVSVRAGEIFRGLQGGHMSNDNRIFSKYPPAEPGALGGEPLKAAIGGATRPQ